MEAALHLIKGRWKLLILFHLFGGHVRRFSALERAIPGVSQKMLTQQLRQLEKAGLVRRGCPTTWRAPRPMALAHGRWSGFPTAMRR